MDDVHIGPKPEEYSIGWICALPDSELPAAIAMLDDRYSDPSALEHDPNQYILGRIGAHNVVIVCLPSGRSGTSPAAVVVTRLQNRFKSVKIGLFVGIGGGVPSAGIRVGDVVVSTAGKGTHSGVVQYDLGRRLPNGKFERMRALAGPPEIVLAAVTRLQSQHAVDDSLIKEYVAAIRDKSKKIAKSFIYQGRSNDRRFPPDIEHKGEENCDTCTGMIDFDRDDEDPRIHYGGIASSNSLMRNAHDRDEIAKDEGVICFEMEAAGLMDTFPCLVIRGIANYSDSHENKRWQPYAAAVAAAYAKDFLQEIKTHDMHSTLALAKASVSYDNIPYAKQVNPIIGRGEILDELGDRCMSDDNKACEQKRRYIVLG